MLRRATAVRLALLAAIVPYFPSIDNYFVQDDFGVVGLLSAKPAAYFPRWFVTTWMDDIWGYTPDEIRPFPALSYQAAAIFGAASPVANHVVNVALHAANTRLVFGLAERVAGLAAGPALMAALTFALLPMQAESVAWITGRVDSLPACAYFAAVLLFVRWRTGGHPGAYAGAVAACFVALFSKQNTVTLLPALAAYDIVIRRQPLRLSWSRAAPYVPFLALTVGYLALRYALFGEIARESMLTMERAVVSLGDLSVHLRRMVLGELGLALPFWQVACGTGAAAGLLAWLAADAAAGTTGRRLRPALYFGPVWIGLAAAPTLVAGYPSPRHMYLASAGWAVLLGLAADVLVQSRRPWVARRLYPALTLLVPAVYGAQLVMGVRDWDRRAEVSRQAVADIERDVLAAPPGSLFVLGVPARSWEYALPHALRPPFTTTDLTGRVRVIAPSPLSCCPYPVWERRTREALAAWAGDPARPPVIAWHWQADSGVRSRLSSGEDPFLESLVRLLPARPTPAELDRMLADIINRYVPGQVAGRYQ